MFQSEYKNVDFSRNISYVVQNKLLGSLMYMCTKVEKLTICDFFLFNVCSLYLYLQDDHQMCLVDTQIGVASGEALFV